MRLLSLLLLLALCFGGNLSAQQQNSTFASFDISLFGPIPATPCTGTLAPFCLNVPAGVDNVCGTVTGPPNAFFQFWSALGPPALSSAVTPGGIVDLDISTAGMPNMFYAGFTGAGTGVIGQFGLCVGGFSPIPAFNVTVQAIVYDPATVAGYTLTAATNIFR